LLGQGLGSLLAAKKFGYSKQRYFQLRALFAAHGAAALQSQKRGPKTKLPAHAGGRSPSDSAPLALSRQWQSGA
jgi:hypothetical protein